MLFCIKIKEVDIVYVDILLIKLVGESFIWLIEGFFCILKVIIYVIFIF